MRARIVLPRHIRNAVGIDPSVKGFFEEHMKYRLLILVGALFILPLLASAEDKPKLETGAKPAPGTAEKKPSASLQALMDALSEPFSIPEVQDELKERFDAAKVPADVESLPEVGQLEKLEGQLVIAYGSYAKARDPENASSPKVEDLVRLGGLHPLGTRSNHVRFTGQVSYNPSQPFSGFLHEKRKRSWILVFRDPTNEKPDEKLDEQALKSADQRNRDLEKVITEYGDRDVSVYAEITRMKLGDRDTDVLLVDRVSPADGSSSEVEIVIVGRVMKQEATVPSLVTNEKDHKGTHWFVQTTGRAFRIKTRGEY